MATTALLHHEAFVDHRTGPGHPERPERMIAIVDHLERTGLNRQLLQLRPQPASVDAIAEVHDRAYIERIAELSRSGTPFYEGLDTVGSPGTFEAARLACGAVMDATEAVLDGRADNAFCVVRPPGHHAERALAQGFCFFNNIAVAARHLHRKHGLSKVAIVDWDVHHGNGTQHTFYEDPSAFFFSIHQYPHYPGTGLRAETGTGDGRDCTLNTPVAVGSTDADYLDIIRRVLRPALRRYEPEFILVSAGFDAHARDPLSGILVTDEGYAELTREVRTLADELCEGRLVSTLEGGYHLEALPLAVESHVRTLME